MDNDIAGALRALQNSFQVFACKFDKALAGIVEKSEGAEPLMKAGDHDV